MAKILVVDDEEAIRSMLKDLLELDGHVVETASDGVEAERYLNESMDLAIVDIIMPHKSGVDFVQELRSIAPGVAVLLISGGGSFKSGANDAMAGWMDDGYIIHKPFNGNEIRLLVEEILCEVGSA